MDPIRNDKVPVAINGEKDFTALLTVLGAILTMVSGGFAIVMTAIWTHEPQSFIALVPLLFTTVVILYDYNNLGLINFAFGLVNTILSMTLVFGAYYTLAPGILWILLAPAVFIFFFNAIYADQN